MKYIFLFYLRCISMSVYGIDTVHDSTMAHVGGSK